LKIKVFCHNYVIVNIMKLTDKRFWLAWLVLLLLAIVSCMAGGWSGDKALLGAAYALSLLSAWLCHRVRPRAASGNLIVMIVYNAMLSYNLIFDSRYGEGLTWWFFALLLNSIHSIALLVYFLIIRFVPTKQCMAH